MKAFALGIALLGFTHIAFSCANFTGGGTKYDGSKAYSPFAYGAIRLRGAINQNLKIDGKVLEEKLRNLTNFNDRSDYSIALMYLGQSKEAVELLEKLESERPGEYFIAANLGTAYELLGNDEKALQWIKEGIHRNPDSHEGPEWLHARMGFSQPSPA